MRVKHYGCEGIIRGEHGGEIMFTKMGGRRNWLLTVEESYPEDEVTEPDMVDVYFTNEELVELRDLLIELTAWDAQVWK